MIKKLFSIGLAGILILFSGVISAAEYKQEYGNDRGILVTGETSADTMVGIQVFKPGKTFADLMVDLDSAGNYVEYGNQVMSDEQGKYLFKFNMNGDSGIYKAYIMNADGVSEELDISFINTEDYDKFLRRLNGLARISNYEEFYSEIVDNFTYFGTDFDSVKANIDLRSMSNRLCDYVKEKPFSADAKIEPALLYNTYIAIQAANEGKLSGIAALENNVYSTLVNDKWIEFVSQKSTASAHMDAVMNYLKPKTPDEFNNAMLEATILGVIRGSGGYNNTENVIKEYKDFLKIDALSVSKYKKLAGEKFMSKEELRKSVGETGTSGDSGSGGLGSGGSKTNTSAAIPGGKYEGAYTESPANDLIKVPFEDIDGVPWATEAITALYDKKIVNGKTEMRFFPDDFVTREEFVKLIITALGVEPTQVTGVFKDVPRDAWFGGYVYAALERNIIKGIDADNFGSGLNITRQDIAVIICNSIQIPSKEKSVEFIDEADIADYAKTAVDKLAGVGIINGTGEGAFSPDSYATRAEAAKMLYGALKYLN